MARALLPALGSSGTLAGAWHPLQVFPRLASVACFPTLGTCCMFSRAWHPLHVFPRLAPVACFSAFTLYTLSNCSLVLLEGAVITLGRLLQVVRKLV